MRNIKKQFQILTIQQIWKSSGPLKYVLHFTLLSVLAALVPPSACATGAAGAAVGLMAETMKKTGRLLVSLDNNLA